MLAFRQMKKADLARVMARRNGVRLSDAADQLDRAVNEILRTLREGRPAHLPGLGTILPGKHRIFVQAKK